jgi:tape measure domain-containing protein
MAETNQFNIEVGVDTKDSISKLKELGSALGDVGKNVKDATASMSSKLASSLKDVGSSISVGLTLPLALFGKSALQIAAQMEQVSVSFEVFTGSAEVASQMLGQLKEQALNSPMQFQDIAKGAQTLLGYGLTAEQVIPITKMLGDVSGGNADKFGRLSLAFGQVNASGRLMGQETRQMINAGFNPLQAISEKTGESMASLSKRMGEGKISVQEVGNAFIYATTEGGRFYGNAEKQSQTLSGAYNKLSESITFLMDGIGRKIAQAFNLKEVLGNIGSFINQLKEKFSSLSPDTQNLIIRIVAITSLIGPLILAIGGLISVFVSVRNAIMAARAAMIAFEFSTGNIIGIGAALIGVLGGATLAWSEYDDAVTKANSNKKDIFSLEERNKQLQNQIGALKMLKALAPEVGQSTATGYQKGKKDLDNEIFRLKNEIIKNQALIKKQKDELTPKLDLNKTPPGLGDSDLTKAEKAKYDALAEQARIGFTNINKQMRTGFESKLDIFDRYAKEELDKFREFGINTAKVEKAQYAMRQQIAQVELAKLSEIVNKNSSIEGLKKSLAKMVDAQVEAISRIMAPMNKSIAGTPKKTMAEFIAAFGDDEVNIDKAFNDLIEQNQAGAINDYATSVYAAQKDFAMSLATGFGEIAGSALAGNISIGEAFDNLGKVFMNAVGDLLIQIGTSAVKLGLAKLGIEAALTAAFGGGGTMIAVGLGAITAGMALKATSAKAGGGTSTSMSASAKMPSVASRASGASYQYGGASFSNQSVRLSIDLTGSITATQTGYSINKSLETTLRITGQ